MNIIQKNILNQYDKAFVYACWNEVYPERFCFNEYIQFELYISQLQSQRHFMLLNDFQNPIGWLCTFEREEQTWFVMLIDNRYKNKQGVSQLLKAAKSVYEELIGWMIVDDEAICKNNIPYQSPVEFYKKNLFQSVPNTREVIRGIYLEKMRWHKDFEMKFSPN